MGTKKARWNFFWIFFQSSAQMVEVVGFAPASCSGSDATWSYAYVRLHFIRYRQYNNSRMILWEWLHMNVPMFHCSCVGC